MRCRATGTGVKKNERNGQKSQKYALGEEVYRALGRNDSEESFRQSHPT